MREVEMMRPRAPEVMISFACQKHEVGLQVYDTASGLQRDISYLLNGRRLPSLQPNDSPNTHLLRQCRHLLCLCEVSSQRPFHEDVFFGF